MTQSDDKQAQQSPVATDSNDYGYDRLDSLSRQLLVDSSAALHTARDAYDHARDTGNQTALALALLMLGLVYSATGDAPSAQASFERAEALYTGWTPERVAEILLRFARAASLAERYSIAAVYFDRGLALCTAHGLRHKEAEYRNQLGINYARQDATDDALREFALAEPIAEETGNTLMRANIWLNIGNVYRRTSDFSQALDYYSRAMLLSSQIDNQHILLLSLNNLGIIYANLGEYANALEYFLRCEMLLEADGTDQAQRYTHTINNIGNLYEILGNYPKALEYHLKALEWRRQMGDRQEEADSLHNLGILYQAMGDLDQAYDYHTRSLAIRETLSDRNDIARSLNGIGTILDSRKQYDEAINFHLRSIALVEATGNRLSKAHFLLDLGTTYMHRGDTEQSLQYQRAALALAEELGARTVICEAHEGLAAVYRSIGDFEMALHHYRLYYQADKELYNDVNSQKMRNLQTLHEVEQTRKEAEIYRLKNVELAAALAELEEANSRLQAVNNEKNELMNIVAHDLKNPLSSIMMLADILRNDRTVTPDEVQEFSTDILTSSERMFNLITTLLDVNAAENRAELLPTFLFDAVPLVQHIARHFVPQAAKKHLTLHETYEHPMMFVEANKDALAQVLDNLVSNAVKFSPSDKNIWITLSTLDSPSAVRIAIRDEGPGLSEEDQARLFKKFARLSAQPTGGEHSTGLGLSIVKRLVEAMRGSIRCESTPGSGATFIVELPAPAPAIGASADH